MVFVFPFEDRAFDFIVEVSFYSVDIEMWRRQLGKIAVY